jgi:hypothetical protein
LQQRGEQNTLALSQRLEEAELEIAELEQERRRLLDKLDFERRFLADYQPRTFKAWLKKNQKARPFAQKLLADQLVPIRGSKGIYSAWLRRNKYTEEELLEFVDLWKLMLSYS